MEEAVPVPEVEAVVWDALCSGDTSALTILGYGEISPVVGWPTTAPTHAYKRLPPFPTRLAAQRHAALFRRYLDVLADRGVTPVDSRFEILEVDDRVVGWVIQPILPAATLGPDVLRAAEPDPDHPLVRGIVDAVAAVCDERTGLDAQVSNWALTDDAVVYLDVTTPMLFDDAGRCEMDLAVFVAALPAAIRRPVRRFVAPGIVASYRDPRKVLVDCAGNLIKERLDDWMPVLVTAANRILEPAITVTEVRRYYRSDARLWEAMLRLRRADRTWQQRVRRRPYPFLLPGPIER